MIGEILPILLNNICMISLILLEGLLAHNEDASRNPHPDHTATARGQRMRQWGIDSSSPLQHGQVAETFTPRWCRTCLDVIEL